MLGRAHVLVTDARPHRLDVPIEVGHWQAPRGVVVGPGESGAQGGEILLGRVLDDVSGGLAHLAEFAAHGGDLEDELPDGLPEALALPADELELGGEVLERLGELVHAQLQAPQPPRAAYATAVMTLLRTS